LLWSPPAFRAEGAAEPKLNAFFAAAIWYFAPACYRLSEAMPARLRNAALEKKL
jgi:hypothetical protein